MTNQENPRVNWHGRLTDDLRCSWGSGFLQRHNADLRWSQLCCSIESTAITFSYRVLCQGSHRKSMRTPTPLIKRKHLAGCPYCVYYGHTELPLKSKCPEEVELSDFLDGLGPQVISEVSIYRFFLRANSDSLPAVRRVNSRSNTFKYSLARGL